MTGDRQDLVDIEAERAVLGEGLRAHARYVSRGLTPADYADPAHRLVAEAMGAVWEAGHPVDLDSVGLWLQRAGRLEAVGGQRGIATLAASGGAFPDGERVRELRRLRELYDAAQGVLLAAARGDLHDALGRVAELQVDALAKRRAQTRDAVEVAEAALQSLVDDAQHGRRVHPGLEGIRRCVGTYQAGSLYIFGASTNVGKTSMALASMLAMAERGIASGYVSFEDSDDVIGARLLAHVSGVSARKFTGAFGDVHPAEVIALEKGVDALKAWRRLLHFDDATGGNELDACAAMTRQAQRGARVCFVDYIQEIEPSRKQDDRRNDIRWVAGRLKAHAKRVGVALVLLSQVTDSADEKRKPTHKDLRDCKDLGNKAEGVLMAWRREVSDSAPIQVYLSKGKNGGLGTDFYLRREAGTGRLVEVTQQEAGWRDADA